MDTLPLPLSLALSFTHTHWQVKGVSGCVVMRGAEGAAVRVEDCAAHGGKVFVVFFGAFVRLMLKVDVCVRGTALVGPHEQLR